MFRCGGSSTRSGAGAGTIARRGSSDSVVPESHYKNSENLIFVSESYVVRKVERVCVDNSARIRRNLVNVLLLDFEHDEEIGHQLREPIRVEYCKLRCCAKAPITVKY
jgi:hypothetical protein